MPPLFDLIASGNVQVDQILIELHITKSNFTSHLKAFLRQRIRQKCELCIKNATSWDVMDIDVLSMHLSVNRFFVKQTQIYYVLKLV